VDIEHNNTAHNNGLALMGIKNKCQMNTLLFKFCTEHCTQIKVKLFISIYLILSSVLSYGQSNLPLKSHENLNEFYSQIKKQFKNIDSMEYSKRTDSVIDYDKIDSLHQVAIKNVIEIIKKYKNEILFFPDTLDYDLLYIARSSDRKFALVSWDTRFGGTMIDFASIALFKTNNNVLAKMVLNLPEVEGGDSSNTLMHYNLIETAISNDGTKTYLAWGNGQGSTAIPWQEVRAFRIMNDNLIQPAIFPKSDTYVQVSFDTHSFKEDEKIPTIKIKNKGKDIFVPIPNDSEGFSGRYKHYYFDGKNYRTR
jgi:hypothetical protein